MLQFILILEENQLEILAKVDHLSIKKELDQMANVQIVGCAKPTNADQH
jgi:hypothetical protein